jgi:hypothetical protein
MGIIFLLALSELLSELLELRREVKNGNIHNKNV